jgi:hypothetical protein
MIQKILLTVLLSVGSFDACADVGASDSSLIDEGKWRIGGKIHFAEQSSVDCVGTIQINELTRRAIKEVFPIKADSCACNAKALLKIENGDFVIRHYEERSKPGIGEEMHATLLYTRRRFWNEHETLRDVYDNLVQVDDSLPRDQAPMVEQVAKTYQKIIEPNLKFEISNVEFVAGKDGSGIIARLLLQGKDEIANKYGNPVSGKFLHMTLVIVDSSAASEIEKINLVVTRLRDQLLGKEIKIGSKHGQADLEFGISGSADRVRPM